MQPGIERCKAGRRRVPDSERTVLETLCLIHADQTVIVITHRPDSIRNVDEIVCMDGGRVVENGSHETLIQKKGFYWQFIQERDV